MSIVLNHNHVHRLLYFAERKSEQPVAINLDSLYDAVEQEKEVAVKLNSTPKEATKTKKRKEKGDNNEAQKKKKKKKPSDQKSSNQQMENDSIIQFLDSPTHLRGTDSTSYGSTQGNLIFYLLLTIVELD
ncbi:Protein of unknown function [Cotesia congregata]|uniref:Uncharacterized protein n=1 Tax=Cotesia congregata TaxID=51543 RepID=A0A8J2HER5_COTCN|nr:Protein of unknown function [Cotesia congregata]